MPRTRRACISSHKFDVFIQSVSNLVTFMKGTHSPLFHPWRNLKQVELQDKGRALCLNLGKVWKSGNCCGNSEPP